MVALGAAVEAARSRVATSFQIQPPWYAPWIRT